MIFTFRITGVLLKRYPAMASDGKHDGVYPLHLAAMNSHTEIARMLLESVNKNKKTAMQMLLTYAKLKLQFLQCVIIVMGIEF